MAQPRPLALVTGASSGIGVEFARELAGRGYDLVITARRLERLAEVGQELQATQGVQVTTIRSDLGAADGADRLFEDVQRAGLKVQLLVNNAGVGKFGPFLDQSPAELLEMIQVNLASLTTLTRRFAQAMRDQGGGYILNNASYSALQPVPYYAVYSATKAYVLALSHTIRYDLRRANVHVSVVCPGFFRSEFFDGARQEPSRLVRWLMLDGAYVARAGIRGVLRKQAVIVPGLSYKFFALSARLMPRTMATVLGQFVVQH